MTTTEIINPLSAAYELIKTIDENPFQNKGGAFTDLRICLDNAISLYFEQIEKLGDRANELNSERSKGVKP